MASKLVKESRVCRRIPPAMAAAADSQKGGARRYVRAPGLAMKLSIPSGGWTLASVCRAYGRVLAEQWYFRESGTARAAVSGRHVRRRSQKFTKT